MLHSVEWIAEVGRSQLKYLGLVLWKDEVVQEPFL